MNISASIVLFAIALLGLIGFLCDIGDVFMVCTNPEFRKKNPRRVAMVIVMTVLLIGAIAVTTYLNAIRVL